MAPAAFCAFIKITGPESVKIVKKVYSQIQTK